MTEPGDDLTQALLDDLAGAEHDVLSLAQRHGLSLDALVRWAQRSATRRTVAGLCALADAQTQLLLSRYRLIAATRLIAHVTADADALPPEQVRRACVDLLKTELSRADQFGALDEADDDAELNGLMRALMCETDDLKPIEQEDADPSEKEAG